MTIALAPALRSTFALLFSITAGLSAVACSGADASSDPNGSSSSQQSSTTPPAPLACATGQIHARACSEPSAAHGEIDDVSNDPTSPCPAGFSPDPDLSAAICCDPVSATEITACYRAQVDCGTDCASISAYGFTPTLCDDPTWGPAHPDVCTDAALDDYASTHDGGAGG